MDLDVDSDGRGAAHLQSLSGGFKSLAGNIRATGTVLAASTIPFAIAGIGAATPAVLALGASLGGLALNLGKAAAGFGLVGAAAGGGALVGLKLYGSLISKTLSDSRTLWEQENDKAVEALQKQRLEILKNARGFDAWNKQINSSLLGFTHLEAAVGSRIFPIFTRELGAWTGKLREMRPFIADTAGRIAQIAVGFSRWFRTADDGQVLREVVGFLSVSAERGARALSLIGRIGISAFRPLIPLATGLQRGVLGILDATNRWVQSAEGQRRLGQIYRSLWTDAKRLAPVLLDLWHGTVQLFNVLDRSGIADQASRGFASLASAYERATRAGGGLDRFLRGALRLMPFVGRATMNVVRAVGNIAQAAIGARVQGSRLTILQSIFRGIGAAARPLQRLVVGTFRDLGPEIARLIPQVARFFSVFAGSSGPLVTFVRVIRRALEIFNSLPSKIKQTVVNLAALKLILGGLGIGAVVAPMGRFASNMLLARGAAARLAGKSGLGAILRFAGPVGVAIAAVAAAGYLMYRNWNRIKGVLGPVVGAFRDFVRQVRPAARELLPTLVRSLRTLASGLLSAIVPGRNLSQQIRNLVNSFAAFVRRAAPPTIRALREINDWLKRNQPTLRTVGRIVGTVLVAAFKVFATNVKIAVGAVRFATNVIRGFASSALETGRTIRRVADAIAGAFKGIADRIVAAFRALPDRLKESGRNAAAGFLQGFRSGLPGNALVEVVNKAREAVKNWQKEHSPSRLWMEQGKNAALGYVKGFGDHIGGLTPALQRTMDDMHVRLLRYGKKLYYTTGKIYSAPGDGTGLIKYPVGTGPLRNLSANQLRQRGSGGMGGDSFGANSRQSSNQGKPGYVQDEDGSWVHNPELYRLQNRYHTGHTYQRGGVGHAFEWTGSGYRYIGGPRGGVHPMARGTDRERFDAYRRRSADRIRQMGGRMFEGVRAGRMTEQWRQTFRNMLRHPNNYDIGGDVDIRDTPRKILQFLKRDGWFRRGGSLYHPDTPKRYLPGGAADGGTPQHMGGRGIDKQQMRDVMREHRHESRKGGDAIDYNRLAHAIVGAMREGLPGFIDHSMGGYFHHRNQAGADPR